METVVHGDDFTTLATGHNIQWLVGELQKHFLIKNRGTLGPDSDDLKDIRVLNRIVSWCSDGIRYEADQRHAAMLVKAFNLQDAKGVETPGLNPSLEDVERSCNNSDKLTNSETTAYRACAARGNFLGLDRPDLQFAAKEISRHMSSPLECDVAALKRFGRYVKRYPRVVFNYKFQRMPSKISFFRIRITPGA